MDVVTNLEIGYYLNFINWESKKNSKKEVKKPHREKNCFPTNITQYQRYHTIHGKNKTNEQKHQAGNSELTITRDQENIFNVLS